MRTFGSRLISVGLLRGVVRSFGTVGEKKIKPKQSLLYKKVVGLGVGGTGGSVAEMVNQHLKEGNTVTRNDLVGSARTLKKNQKYHHALELMEWMEKRGDKFFYTDHALFINLLSQVKGIEAAEKYFCDLSVPARNTETYSALLNSYCQINRKSKALALFETMRHLNLASTSLDYNNLMSLHMKLGELEKVLPLEQEMKDRNIPLDSNTYGILITCYASLNNAAEVERLANEMETKDSARRDWTTYSNLASTYVKAGLFEKAELALKELERNMKDDGQEPYHFMISLYADVSNLSEVYRIWHSLKSAFPCTTDKSYLIMLEALDKLDDFDGLQKYFQESESGRSEYDLRLVNVLVRAYLKRHMFNEIKLLCRDTGMGYRIYDLLVDYFLKNRQLDRAMRCLEARVAALKQGSWKPQGERVSAFLKLFVEKKDFVGAEKFREMLKKNADLDWEVHSLLLSTHVAGQEEDKMSQKTEGDSIDKFSEIEDKTDQKMEADAMDKSSEIEELLKEICPE